MTRKAIAQFSIVIYEIEGILGVRCRRYDTVVVDVNTEQEVYYTRFVNPALKLHSACRRAGEIIARYVNPSGRRE